MKVATIERIAEINPHPNADALELAKINGWQVCVKKNEFKANRTSLSKIGWHGEKGLLKFSTNICVLMLRNINSRSAFMSIFSVR